MSGTRRLSFLGFGMGSDSKVLGGHDGSASDVVHLDDEMEDVFNLVDADRFKVAQLTTGPGGVNPRRTSAHDLHQNRSFPHAHSSMKGRARRWSAASVVGAGSVPRASGPPEPLSETDADQPEPALSSRDGQAARGASPDSAGSPGTSDRRVQFDQFKEVAENTDPSSKRRKSRHHHTHHHRARKYSLQEEPQWKREGRRVSVQPEDATLAEADLEDLDSHRSDDPRGLRRPKIQKSAGQGSYVHIGRKRGNDNLQEVLSSGVLKKMYDRSPHAVFVQLDELLGTGEDREWKETARWIKYEEDVEEGSDRWGRPHVASLSFHSLLNLRRCLQNGVVLLDLDEKDLAGVAHRITEQMVIDELITDEDKPVVMRSLLMRHKHVNESDKGFRFSIRKASYASLQTLWEERAGLRRSTLAGPPARCSVCSPSLSSPPPPMLIKPCRRHSANVINLSDGDKVKAKMVQLDTSHEEGTPSLNSDTYKIDMKEETYVSTSQEDLKKANNESILRRIPEGAEATTVLVGAVGYLSQPTIAFVRLAQGVMMPTITEVTIPVRFMFVLLGPSDADLDYHEVGRSISTLMSNSSFHQIAYKADGRKDLLSAINEFLDDSIVLPPGNWESQALLPFEELKAKSHMIMKRKRDAILKNQRMSIDVGLIKAEELKSSLLKTDMDGEPYIPPIDPLKRTRRPFGGLINDIKRRYPFYLSDFIDGLNGQCFAAAIFMYFAALSSAITFGGLIGDKTGNLMGISETLLSTALAGIAFALISGQPMMVVGTTGPLLLFDESLFNFCISLNINFLTLRAFLGFWLAVIGLLVAFVEGSVLVKQFTRFTEDIFSSLISLIFIMEAVMKLISVFSLHPLLPSYCGGAIAALTAGFLPDSTTTLFTSSMNNSIDELMVMDDPNIENTSSIANISDSEPANMMESFENFSEMDSRPNTALFCTLLTLGTFMIAYFLRIFRNSKFLGRSMRRALGDFGVPIAIIIMVAINYFTPQVYTEKLSVPEGLTPSDPTLRGWFISLSGSEDNPFPLWAMFAAALPALMIYIIIFMETHIAELIVDKPERNLKKGSGFHMDIVIICILNGFCGLIGAPWVCVATVRSVSHVSALTVMSRTHAPGDKPYITEVKEQRLSALIVSILVGVSVTMASLLSLVPLSVLFGIFLYMGIASMNGIQLFERVILFLMPVKHHPSVPYVNRVPTWKMHMYTLIQVGCLTLLWVVKSTRASLAFPFLLIMMVPLRSQLRHFFTPMELRALDGKQPDLDTDDEPDFYEEATIPG